MPASFRPEEFVRELEALASVRKPWAIIGGMATIIWADRFLAPDEVRRLGSGRHWSVRISTFGAAKRTSMRSELLGRACCSSLSNSSRTAAPCGPSPLVHLAIRTAE